MFRAVCARSTEHRIRSNRKLTARREMFVRPFHLRGRYMFSVFRRIFSSSHAYAKCLVLFRFSCCLCSSFRIIIRFKFVAECQNCNCVEDIPVVLDAKHTFASSAQMKLIALGSDKRAFVMALASQRWERVHFIYVYLCIYSKM